MRGRPPKPTELKRRAGNPGKRPLPEEPRGPQLAEMPRAPRGMNAPARRLWRTLGPVLVEMGVLTRADLPAFQLLCQHWGLAQQAWEALQQEGETTTDERGLPRKHPLLQVWRDNSRAWREYAAHFGLTPAARARLGLAWTEKEKSLAELLFEAAARAKVVEVKQDDAGGDVGDE